jgi:hypothetical protein
LSEQPRAAIEGLRNLIGRNSFGVGVSEQLAYQHIELNFEDCPLSRHMPDSAQGRIVYQKFDAELLA